MTTTQISRCLTVVNSGKQSQQMAVNEKVLKNKALLFKDILILSLSLFWLLCLTDSPLFFSLPLHRLTFKITHTHLSDINTIQSGCLCGQTGLNSNYWLWVSHCISGLFTAQVYKSLVLGQIKLTMLTFIILNFCQPSPLYTLCLLLALRYLVVLDLYEP